MLHAAIMPFEAFSQSAMRHLLGFTYLKASGSQCAIRGAPGMVAKLDTIIIGTAMGSWKTHQDDEHEMHHQSH